MSAIAVLGGQWGDEGKGKIVDLLAEQADYIVRFSGGDNAGHTVINPHGEFKLHLIPSGIFYPEATAVIGNGVAVNPAVLLQELDELRQHGVRTGRLLLSHRAHIIMPYHVLLDGLEEKSRGKDAIGTTGKGIGPVFADKVARMGIRAVDLLDEEALRRRLRTVLEHKNAILTRVYGAPALSLDDITSQYAAFGKQLSQFICNTEEVLHNALREGKKVLLEGAQGSLLDPDFGSYPYVTSSSPLIGGAMLGSGISLQWIKHVVGVFKAYTTRVGGGPMPTELTDDIGSLIRERAQEYGTTTGRPRRCGWFDGVAGRFSSRINGLTSFVLTRLDVLDVLPKVRICVGYRFDGQTVEVFPCDLEMLAKCEPVYEEMPGWLVSTSDVRSYSDLPQPARDYIGRLEQTVGCPASIISVGPRRDQTITRMSLS